MHRRTRFIVGFAAAAITFGSLLAFVGPHRHHHHHCGDEGHQHRCEQHMQQHPQSGHENTYAPPADTLRK